MPKNILLALAILTGIRLAGQPISTDQQQILLLVRSFASAMAQGENPSPFLAPNISGEPAEKGIKIARKRYLEFDISGFSVERDLKFTNEHEASLKAWVSYRTPRLSQQSEVTLQFQKVGEKWYLANFDFLAFNWRLTVLMCLFGTCYAVVVLSFFYHLRGRVFRKGIWKLGWLILLFTPVGWALYPLLKPWRISPPKIADT